jgi:hypothetical protein
MPAFVCENLNYFQKYGYLNLMHQQMLCKYVYLCVLILFYPAKNFLNIFLFLLTSDQNCMKMFVSDSECFIFKLNKHS